MTWSTKIDKAIDILYYGSMCLWATTIIMVWVMRRLVDAKVARNQQRRAAIGDAAAKAAEERRLREGEES
jgi:hypothetical protein